MVHRAVAVLIVLAATAVFLRVSTASRLRATKTWSGAWLALIGLQAGLGAWTIWSNKAADIATAHMAVGALALLLGAVFSFRLCRAGGLHRFRLPEPGISTVFVSRVA